MEESKSESWMVNEHLLYFDFEDVQNAWKNPNTKNLYISEDNACEVRQTELLVCGRRNQELCDLGLHESERGCKLPVAIKAIRVNSDLGAKSMVEIDRELAALQLLCSHDSEYLMKYHGYCRRFDCTFIICDYINGPTLRDWILEKTDSFDCSKDSWMLRKKIATSIASGVKRIHLLQAAHNDINPSNIILKIPFLEPVIIDVGIATLKAENPGKKSTIAKLGPTTLRFATGAYSKGFTLGYVAPERNNITEIGLLGDQLADIYRYMYIFLSMMLYYFCYNA